MNKCLDCVSDFVNGCKDYVSEKKKEIGVGLCAGALALVTAFGPIGCGEGKRGEYETLIGAALASAGAERGNAGAVTLGKILAKYGIAQAGRSEMNVNLPQQQVVQQETVYREPEIIIAQKKIDDDRSGDFNDWNEIKGKGNNYYDSLDEGFVVFSSESYQGPVKFEIYEAGTNKSVMKKEETLTQNQIWGIYNVKDAKNEFNKELKNGNYYAEFTYGSHSLRSPVFIVDIPGNEKPDSIKDTPKK